MKHTSTSLGRAALARCVQLCSSWPVAIPVSITIQFFLLMINNVKISKPAQNQKYSGSKQPLINCRDSFSRQPLRPQVPPAAPAPPPAHGPPDVAFPGPPSDARQRTPKRVSCFFTWFLHTGCCALCAVLTITSTCKTKKKNIVSIYLVSHRSSILRLILNRILWFLLGYLR